MLEIITTLIIIAVSLYGYIIYGLETKRRILRPRAATWLIWGILSTCVSILQIEHQAGPGAVATVIAAGANFILAGIAWYYGHRNIHLIDIVSSIAALGVLVLWLLSNDTITVIFATLTYLIGFMPTFERAYRKPFHEKATPFITSVIKYTLSVAVVGSVSLETVLYPAVLAILNLIFLVMLVNRRKQRKKHEKSIAK